MPRWIVALVLTVSMLAPAGSMLAQEPPANQCGDMMACRTAEVNLLNYYGLPLTLQGQSTCAQFCSADYWVRHAPTGTVLLQFGHGGAMGPPLLAWGVVGQGQPAENLRVRTVAWVYRPNPTGLDDGWYEDTAYTWDATRETLVAGEVRRLVPEDRDRLVRSLEGDGLQVLFTPVR
jgi:hypothetical protein